MKVFRGQKRARAFNYPNRHLLAFISALSVTFALTVGGLDLSLNNAIAKVEQDDLWKIGTQLSRLSPRVSSTKGEPLSSSLGTSQTVRNAHVSMASAADLRGTRTRYLVLNVEFVSTSARLSFRQQGASVFTGIDRFADIFVTSEQVAESIYRRRDVVWAEPVGIATAPPPPSPGKLPVPTRQLPEAVIRNGFQGITGRGVVIAIVDSGIDFRNHDFVNYDSEGRPTSRLLYLWDTTSNVFDSTGLGTKAPLSYPNGASIGTLFTRAQLTQELRSTVRRIPATDLNGHGTACAGVAAGNGNSDRGVGGLNRAETIGVAPDADLVAIRIGKEDDHFENSYLLNAAVGWLDKVLGSTPLVVSYSAGGHRGGHDGQLIAERQLDARFSLARKSRAIVAAAGNEGTEPIHAIATFQGQNSAALVRWHTVYENTLQIYFNGDDDDIIIAPAGSTKLTVMGSWINPLTKQLVASVKVGSGKGGLWLYSDSSKKNTADLYISEAGFASDVVSYETLVGNPATASNVIAVGSYDWNDMFDLSTGKFSFQDSCGYQKALVIGGLSCYSSPGYSRNGTVKPEIVAPGEWFTASYAKNLNDHGVGKDWTSDKTGRFVAMNGTSAATPYTAGIIALMFQKKPLLTFGEIRQLLTMNASSNDLITGPVPNPNWGHGKLDVAAVAKIMNGLDR